MGIERQRDEIVGPGLMQCRQVDLIVRVGQNPNQLQIPLGMAGT